MNACYVHLKIVYRLCPYLSVKLVNNWVQAEKKTQKSARHQPNKNETNEKQQLDANNDDLYIFSRLLFAIWWCILRRVFFISLNLKIEYRKVYIAMYQCTLVLKSVNIFCLNIYAHLWHIFHFQLGLLHLNFDIRIPFKWQFRTKWYRFVFVFSYFIGWKAFAATNKYNIKA